MRFPSTTVLSILLTIWIVIVAEVLRAVWVYSSQVHLASPHLAPMHTSNGNYFKSEGAMFLCLAKAAATSSTPIVPGKAGFMQHVRSQMIFSRVC